MDLIPNLLRIAQPLLYNNSTMAQIQSLARGLTILETLGQSPVRCQCHRSGSYPGGG